MVCRTPHLIHFDQNTFKILLFYLSNGSFVFRRLTLQYIWRSKLTPYHLFFAISLSISLSFLLFLHLRHCQSLKNIFYELSYHFSHFSLIRNRFQKHTGQKIPLLFSNLTDTGKKWFLKGYLVSVLQSRYSMYHNISCGR